MLTMKEKLRDNKISRGKIRKIGKIEDELGKNNRPCRRVRTEVHTHCQKLRKEVKAKLRRKEDFLVKRYGNKKPLTLDDLSEEDRLRYKEALIFMETTVGRHELLHEEASNDENNVIAKPMIVCMEGEEIVISNKEAALLALGPKFCTMVLLSEAATVAMSSSLVLSFPKIHSTS